MPSRYEPCGLNQIYSLKYGTVPIVRATGGLDDTIEPWDARTGKGTGFKFYEYNGESLLLTIKAALQAFRDESSWQVLMRNGMARDFSWVSIGEGVRQGLRPSPARQSRGRLNLSLTNFEGVLCAPPRPLWLGFPAIRRAIHFAKLRRFNTARIFSAFRLLFYGRLSQNDLPRRHGCLLRVGRGVVRSVVERQGRRGGRTT